MIEEEFDNIVSNLVTIYNNLKKAPNRRYAKETLRKKLEKASEYYNSALALLNELEEEQEQKSLLAELRALHSSIRIDITSRLETYNLVTFKSLAQVTLALIKTYKGVKMAVPRVDLKLGTAIIHSFDGNSDGVGAFVDSVNLFNLHVEGEFAAATVDQKATAAELVLQFVKTRLTGKARAAAGDNPATLALLIERVEQRCGSTKTVDVVLAKLKSTKQSGEMAKFTTEIESLTLQLEKAYVKEQIPLEVATKLATKEGVRALCSGVRNNETKLLLKSGNFETMAAAVVKVLENDNTTATATTSGNSSTSAAVLYTRRGGRGGQYRGRGGNYQMSQNFQKRGGFQNPPRYNHQQGHNYQSGYYRPNGLYNNNSQKGGARGNFRGQPRVFLAAQQPLYELPQQPPQGMPAQVLQPQQYLQQPQQQQQQSLEPAQQPQQYF